MVNEALIVTSSKFHESFINLTYVCNNNCSSCIMENHYQNTIPSFDKIIKKINFLRTLSNHIEFNGGEPTLHKDFFKIIKYSNQFNNLEVGVISNARFFAYSRNVKRLTNLNLKNFKLITTIYGPSSKIHDAITRTPNSFVQQIKGIKNLVSAGVCVELRVVVSKQNYLVLREISDFISNTFSNQELHKINFINAKLIGQAFKNKKIVALETNKSISYLSFAVKRLIRKKFNVVLSHFPHCLLDAELKKLSVGISAENSEIIFLNSCLHCKEKIFCSGIWDSYVHIFGGDKFKPIK